MCNRRSLSRRTSTDVSIDVLLNLQATHNVNKKHYKHKSKITLEMVADWRILRELQYYISKAQIKFNLEDFQYVQCVLSFTNLRIIITNNIDYVHANGSKYLQISRKYNPLINEHCNS
jgi:hypothetical protein